MPTNPAPKPLSAEELERWRDPRTCQARLENSGVGHSFHLVQRLLATITQAETRGLLEAAEIAHDLYLDWKDRFRGRAKAASWIEAAIRERAKSDKP